MQHSQTVLVLVGLPGSGKSTLARLFAEQGWEVVCQDDHGNRKACEAAAWQALEAGRSVVIDRCNHDAMQRSHWVDIARRQRGRGRGAIQLLALCLELPADVCLQRAVARAGHATLAPEEAPEVIERFKREWQYPQRREGFDAILVAHTSEEAAAVAAQLLQQQQAAAAQAAVEPAVPQWVAGVGAAQLAQPASYSMQPNGAGMYPPGQQRQPQQNGWQQQQRQPYRSRADSAGSWRRSAETEPGESATSRGSGEQPAPGGGSNVVPFPAHHRQQGQRQQHDVHPHRPRPHPWQRYGPDERTGAPLDAAPELRGRLVLMFDANGTITSHTSMRRSSGLHKARPGIEHLRRLKERFVVGMYSSASSKTVATALELLEAAAGPGDAPLFDRGFVLHRSHTMLAPAAHVAAGGKEWDTVKPLRPYFRSMHRVVLVDDDAHKACAGEERNMLLMPRWEGHDPDDAMVGHLADVLLQVAADMGDDPEADVRQFTAQASARLAALAEEERARRRQQEGEGGEQQPNTGER